VSEDPETSASGEGTAKRRHDRTTSHPTRGGENSLYRWWRTRNPLRVVVQLLVIVIARYVPQPGVKNWLYRRLGMTVGSGVAFALESTPDVFWPDRITVEDHAIVGYDATILCHEYLQAEYRVGDVVIGERAMIGAGAIVLPGVVIGSGARVAANSLVTRDVPPGTTVAGVPAEPVERDPPADDGA
jgi:acetyltransferase-like isoleucine patch superfamily enzyme